jgi:RHS repeat-associated protein
LLGHGHLPCYSDLAATTKIGSSAYTYDGDGRLTNLQHLDGNNVNLANYTYTYDQASRVTSETLNGSTTTYTYDQTDQLTSDGTATYTYDANGNRTMTGYSTGTGNEITSDGIWTYYWDNEGNLIKKTKGSNAETWTFGYDNQNHLLWAKDSATDGGSILTLATYTYDALGDRIEKDVWTSSSGTTTVTRYAYDGQDVFAELDGTNTLQTRYLLGDEPDQYFARITVANGASWYLPDRLGSIRDITNASGAVQDHLAYDGFGNKISESNPSYSGSIGYAGMGLDGETSFYVTAGRYYDPHSGRWISQDPAGFGAGDDNLYRYVSNSPTNFTDPSGLSEQGANQWPSEDARRLAKQELAWRRRAKELAAQGLEPFQIIGRLGLPPSLSQQRNRWINAADDCCLKYLSGEPLTPEEKAAELRNQAKWEKAVQRAKELIAQGSFPAKFNIRLDEDGRLLLWALKLELQNNDKIGLSPKSTVAGGRATVVLDTREAIQRAAEADAVLRENGRQYARRCPDLRLEIPRVNSFGPPRPAEPGFWLMVFGPQEMGYGLGWNAICIVGGLKAESIPGLLEPVQGSTGLPARAPIDRGVPHPSTPVGRSGNPLGSVQPNAPTTIAGRPYTGHALDQMQARGIPPSAVENTVQHGVPGRPQPVGGGTSSHFDPVNNITVITDTASGRVVTVFPGR